MVGNQLSYFLFLCIFISQGFVCLRLLKMLFEFQRDRDLKSVIQNSRGKFSRQYVNP